LSPLALSLTPRVWPAESRHLRIVDEHKSFSCGCFSHCLVMVCGGTYPSSSMIHQVFLSAFFDTVVERTVVGAPGPKKVHLRSPLLEVSAPFLPILLPLNAGYFSSFLDSGHLWTPPGSPAPLFFCQHSLFSGPPLFLSFGVLLSAFISFSAHRRSSRLVPSTTPIPVHSRLSEVSCVSTIGDFRCGRNPVPPPVICVPL